MDNRGSLRVVGHDFGTQVDQLAPHWLPRYSRRLPPAENAFLLARPLWGTPRARWALTLAHEVLARGPAGPAREWVAAVLCAAAREHGMDDDPSLWQHILGDIAVMTGVPVPTVSARHADLVAVGMDRPAAPPAQGRDVGRADH